MGGCFALFVRGPITPFITGFTSLPILKTNIAPENRPGPKRKCHLPTIHFQGRAVSFREGCFSYSSIICAFRNVPRLLKLPLRPGVLSDLPKRTGGIALFTTFCQGLLYIILETSQKQVEV